MESITGFPLIEARGIVKRFARLVANDGVDLAICRGEVHALLGENGAGKSTLCKILCGFYRADAGELDVNGTMVRMASPREARALGIGMVFQNFMLVPAFSVYENIALFLPGLPFVLRRREILRRIGQHAERFHLTLRLGTPVRQLSIGEQQKLEILKQLVAGARVLILDEPTSVLAPPEVKALLRIIAALKAEGFGILFICHKLREVLACADRITVMRHGRVTGCVSREVASEAGLISLMFDQSAVEKSRERSSVRAGRCVLELVAVSTARRDSEITLRDITFRLHAGEIVGIIGVAGNGQREFGDVILGVLRPVSGKKLLWGQDASAWSIRQVRDSGVAFVPENSLAMACIPGMTLRENFALGSHARDRSGLRVNWVHVRARMAASFAQLQFPMPPVDAPVAALSGGNLQRAVLARELAENPALIVALHPTRGLDVPSATAIRKLLLDARDAGRAVLLVSEDLDELFTHCDRLVVMFGGTIAGELPREQYDTTIVGQLMTGVPVVAHAR